MGDPVLELSGSDSSNATSYTAASHTPPANTVLLFYWAYTRITNNPPTPTMTGWSLTWTQLQTDVYQNSGSNRRGHTLFVAETGASPGASAAVLDFGGTTVHSGIWGLLSCPDAPLGNGGQDAIIQSTQIDSGNSSVTNLAINHVGAFAAGTNYAVDFQSSNNTGGADYTPTSGFAELVDIGVSTQSCALFIEHRVGDFDADPSFTSGQAGAILIELGITVGGGADQEPALVGGKLTNSLLLQHLVR